MQSSKRLIESKIQQLGVRSSFAWGKSEPLPPFQNCGSAPYFDNCQTVEATAGAHNVRAAPYANGTGAIDERLKGKVAVTGVSKADARSFPWWDF